MVEFILSLVKIVLLMLSALWFSSPLLLSAILKYTPKVLRHKGVEFGVRSRSIITAETTSAGVSSDPWNLACPQDSFVTDDESKSDSESSKYCVSDAGQGTKEDSPQQGGKGSSSAPEGSIRILLVIAHPDDESM